MQAQKREKPGKDNVSSVVATGRLMNGAAGFTLAGLQTAPPLRLRRIRLPKQLNIVSRGSHSRK
jgi:hypothetical protein